MFTANSNHVPKINEILARRQLSSAVIELTVYEPRIATKCQAGQFFMLRTCARGERIPFTFSDWSREEGWIRFIFMVVGKTTAALSELEVGERIQDVAGPMGRPSLRRPDDCHSNSDSGFEGLALGGNIAIVGGGVGVAVAYPVARTLCEEGYKVHAIIGARSANLLILEDELRALPLESLTITTDDGSAGEKALVTAPLKELCTNGQVNHAVIIGPAIMMKHASATALSAGVPATVSLNPLMIDGTGMCGACRVTIDGKTKFACVDGPDFSAASVDWAELMSRQRTYSDDERLSHAIWQEERLHDDCDCFGEKSLWSRNSARKGE